MRLMSPPRLSSSDIRKAASGTIVTGSVAASGSSANKLYAAALVDVPIGRLWSGINDETRHAGYTSMAYTELIKGRPCQDHRRILQFMDIPVPFVSDRWWIGVRSSNKNIEMASGASVREVKWTSSVSPSEVTSSAGQKIIGSGVPINFTKGAWFLVAITERHTWVEYYSWTDPGSGIPSSIANSAASGGIRDAVLAMRKFSKEGNPSCPIY